MPSRAFASIGQTRIDRWDWDRDETVEVVEDGAGNRFLVVQPVDDGRLELRVKAEDVSEAKVVTAYLDRHSKP